MKEGQFRLPLFRMFQASLLDKLTTDDLGRGFRSVEAVKESVARDVEHLLNTRLGERIKPLDYPHLSRSVANFGLEDFAAMSLSSQEDRDRICEDIRQSILAHEPRLRRPAVHLAPQATAQQRLHFSIRATLLIEDQPEPVSFDAVLQPTSLHYRVNQAA